MKGNIVRIEPKTKGYGFILGEDGNDYFLHISKLSGCIWEELTEGDEVFFEPLQRDKLIAINVQKYKNEKGEISKESEKQVYAGINPMVKLYSFQEAEKQIVRTLAKTFYVTNGGTEIHLGATSKYRYCLVKPTALFGEKFNLKREMVVVFSDYEKFEPRTFDAIAEVFNRNKQEFRIDKICSIIVSKDRNVCEEVAQILKSDVEMQVVVPFSYEELYVGNKTALITKRFQEFFYERDLFAFESPLKKDIYFFGRREYVHELISRHNSAENSGVFGLRRSGKTSVLQAVERATKYTNIDCVFVDCQNLYHFSWYKALSAVIIEIKKKCSTLVEINTENYTEENANAQFINDIEVILNDMDHDILLLMDEIEQITPGLGMKENWKLGDDFVKFWHTIRSCFHRWGHRFTFILAGTNPSAIEQISINKHDNPLFNQLKFDTYLPPFDFSNTREMVNKLGIYMGLSFDDTVCAKLTQDFGGHPYLMRHFCSAINSYIVKNHLEKPIRVTNAIYDKVMPIFSEKSADNYCRFILGVLIDYYPEENKFLEKLALGNIKEYDREVYDPQMIAHLVGYGIIESNQGVLGFKIEVLKNYLSRKYAYRRQNMTTKEKWAEISERRNQVEPQIRIIVKNQLKAKFGTGAKQKVLESMRQDIRAKYVGLSYNDLFDPKKCEIYFLQLGNLIEKNWEDCFKNIFSKNKPTIKSYFTIINNLRLECHAAEVTEAEMESFRGVMSMLEKECSNYFE